MDELTYVKFKELVLQKFTVTAIRTQLGSVLEEFTDHFLIAEMLIVLRGDS